MVHNNTIFNRFVYQINAALQNTLLTTNFWTDSVHNMEVVFRWDAVTYYQGFKTKSYINNLNQHFWWAIIFYKNQ